MNFQEMNMIVPTDLDNHRQYWADILLEYEQQTEQALHKIAQLEQKIKQCLQDPQLPQLRQFEEHN